MTCRLALMASRAPRHRRQKINILCADYVFSTKPAYMHAYINCSQQQLRPSDYVVRTAVRPSASPPVRLSVRQSVRTSVRPSIYPLHRSMCCNNCPAKQQIACNNACRIWRCNVVHLSGPPTNKYMILANQYFINHD